MFLKAEIFIFIELIYRESLYFTVGNIKFNFIIIFNYPNLSKI